MFTCLHSANHQTKRRNKEDLHKNRTTNQRLLDEHNRDSPGLFAENLARRGAASSGSIWKQAAELRTRSRSRAEPGIMLSHGYGISDEVLVLCVCFLVFLVVLPVLPDRPCCYLYKSSPVVTVQSERAFTSWGAVNGSFTAVINPRS